MKRKTLGFMNIKHDVLSREEMRSIMAGSGDGGTCSGDMSPCYKCCSDSDSENCTDCTKCSGACVCYPGYSLVNCNKCDC